MKRRTPSRLAAAAVAVGLAAGCLMPAAAVAHGLLVYAWVVGDTVHVEGKFSGGRKVAGGTVEVEDAQGRRLLTGTTDAQGRFDFPLPGRGELKIAVSAGMGHRGVWRLTAADIAAGASPPEQETPAARPLPPPPATAAAPRDGAPAGIDTAAVEAAVERALERRLGPLLEALAAERRRGPGLRDILGGVGYILGLAGIAAWAHGRRKSRC